MSVVIIAGTTGTGKSTIGARLTSHYNTDYIEGDDVHPKENVDKMSQGIPLTDEDRWGWLQKLSQLASLKAKSSKDVIIASCSALKKVYRDYIQQESPQTKFIFIFLYASIEELIKRTEQRQGHYMKSSMVQSQFDILQLPYDEPNALVLNVSDKSIGDITNEAIAYIDSKI